MHPISAEEKPWLRHWPSEVPTNLSYPDMPLFGLLSRMAKKYPQQPAIIYLDRQITYKELNALSDRFAAALASLGVAKGERVAVILPNIPQLIIAYYGLLKAGAVFTAINPSYREREIEHQLTDSEAETILALDSIYSVIETIKKKTQLKHVILTNLNENAENHFTQNSSKQKTDVYSFQDLLKEDNKPRKIHIDPSKDLAALQYTGGTTGISKAAMLTHKNLIANALAFAAWINSVENKETFLVALPLFHIYGLTTSLNVPISVAAKMVLLPRFDPAKALSTIEAHHVSVFCGVPTMYQALLANTDLLKYDLTSIRVCISGAAPLPPQVQKSFLSLTGGLLVEGYGLTEASPVTHCNPLDKAMRTVKIGSIGLPLPDTEAKIVDAETGTKTLNVGEIGELAVNGPQIMKGYWKQVEETNLTLRDGWLLTGDIGCMDEEGYFYITDRKKDLIKYKGCSVYPREIEDILYEHPAVRLCAVVGKPDATAGEVPKAFVVLREGASASMQELVDFVKGKVASYKILREIEFRKELPLSAAGKVLRRSLRIET